MGEVRGSIPLGSTKTKDQDAIAFWSYCFSTRGDRKGCQTFCEVRAKMSATHTVHVMKDPPRVHIFVASHRPRFAFRKLKALKCHVQSFGLVVLYFHMNNFERVNNTFEENPDQKIIKLNGQLVPKIIRELEIRHSLDDTTQIEIDKILKRTSRKNNVVFDKDTLLFESLDRIAIRDGGLSDKLKQAYEKLLAERIVDIVQKQGVDTLYDVLREQLGSRSVYIDDEDVEKIVTERLSSLGADSLETVEEEA